MALRSPIFSNGPSEMSRIADAASQDAIFAYALGDLLLDVERHGAIETSPGYLGLDMSTWSELWRRGGGKAITGKIEATRGRAWERWKEKIVGLGLGRRTGAPSTLFEIDRVSAARWIEEAIRRGNELAEAYRQATGKELEVLRAPSATETERTLSADDLAEALGVEVHTVYGWVKAGVPCERVPGTKGYGTLAFNVKEVEAWLAGRMDASRKVAAHYENRIPVEEGSRRLLAARDTLGLSTQVFAKKLGVNPRTLWLWLAKSIPTVPLKVVLDAELLLEERGISPQDAKPTDPEERMAQSLAGPRLKAARAALNMSVSVFAEALGVPAVTLKSWLGTGGKIAKAVPVWAVEGAEELVETMEPRVYKTSGSKLADPEHVRAAFEEAHGGLSAAARILGVTPSAAKAAAARLGIQTTRPTVLKDVISAEDLRAALERHGGNTSAASRELGIDRPSVVRLAEEYGAVDLVQRQAEPIVVEREVLKEAVVRLGSVMAAANELGLSRSTALRLAKSHGLGEFIRRGGRPKR